MSLPGAVVLIIGVALCWMSRVVLLVVAAGGGGGRGGRDFTAQDIVQLYPATTPFPGGFKCFTCEDARDNYDCNRWAPDVFCPQGSRYCYTRHLMDGLGASESVTKRCVAVHDCVGTTGCRTLADAARRTECVSCCEGNICNLPVPRNHSDAVFSTETPVWPSGASPCRSARWPVLCALLGALMLPV
ncbi:ly6/PLAUR domain-containing protein 6-like [Lethenteron reissneri]|uniref:ly6/PLAUR domain-containing protein 6-like n=1 Tax=Lethenteron reissneri TaxID=7753 RepID=UPI002AB79C64|nr:ly6/PLAUR domain-containing protein 6-like [Lethenteron reissneri]XP_061419422.1 ly6/PLAUR domain-containing protein 6-like [Lethenteron reissneri]XP_061419423.1 ly6/PLAUR domain-containing protein 6-like [Lethenteron reissneri]